MYYNRENRHHFLDGERAGLQASRLYARMAWDRADADAQRVAMAGDEAAAARSHAMRERFRAAHKEAMAFEADVADPEDSEYGDMDEYGYAA